MEWTGRADCRRGWKAQKKTVESGEVQVLAVTPAWVQTDRQSGNLWASAGRTGKQSAIDGGVVESGSREEDCEEEKVDEREGRVSKRRSSASNGE